MTTKTAVVILAPVLTVFVSLSIPAKSSVRLLSRVQAAKIYGGDPCDLIGQSNHNGKGKTDNPDCTPDQPDDCVPNPNDSACLHSEQQRAVAEANDEMCEDVPEPGGYTIYCDCNDTEACTEKRTCKTEEEYTQGGAVTWCETTAWLQDASGQDCLQCTWSS